MYIPKYPQDTLRRINVGLRGLIDLSVEVPGDRCRSKE